MNKSQYYPALDAMRFCAAVLVLLDHFSLFAATFPSATVPEYDRAFHFLGPMSDIGSIGVEIFFLISGFIIPASSLGVSAKLFAYRRAIRILPALWMSATIAFVARLTTRDSPWALVGDLLRSAVLSPVGPYIDGVVWTLVVEAVFYLVIFLLILSNKFAKTEFIVIFLGLVSSIYISLLAVATYLAPDNHSAYMVMQLLGRFAFKVFLMRYGTFFALGMAIWYYFQHKMTLEHGAFVILLLIFCSLEIVISRQDLKGGLVALVLWTVSLGTIIISTRFPEQMSIKSPTYTKLARQLGRLSYPLYLNHYVLGMILVAYFGRLGLIPAFNFSISASIVFMVSYIMMSVPERLIQQRLLAKIRHQ